MSFKAFAIAFSIRLFRQYIRYARTNLAEFNLIRGYVFSILFSAVPIPTGVKPSATWVVVDGESRLHDQMGHKSTEIILYAFKAFGIVFGSTPIPHRFGGVSGAFG